MQTNEGRHYLTPSADGSKIRLTETRIELHPLKTDFDDFILLLSIEGRGYFRFHSENGLIFLPEGRYDLVMYTGYFDHLGERWTVTSDLLDPNKIFTMEAGNNFLSIRSTPVPHIIAKTQGDRVIFEEALRGALDDEQYFIDPSGRNWNPRTFSVENMEGDTIGRGRFEAG